MAHFAVKWMSQPITGLKWRKLTNSGFVFSVLVARAHFNPCLLAHGILAIFQVVNAARSFYREVIGGRMSHMLFATEHSPTEAAQQSVSLTVNDVETFAL